MPPDHHKELARFLIEKFQGKGAIKNYRNNSGNRPVPVGHFGKSFFSTIGAFDMGLRLPEGDFEFAACGDIKWLPNSLASSIYWLRDRSCSSWPLVCEDVVKDNAKSIYRHMVYMPSPFGLELSNGSLVHWLLGVPVKDKDINISGQDVLRLAFGQYPEWLLFDVG